MAHKTYKGTAEVGLGFSPSNWGPLLGNGFGEETDWYQLQARRDQYDVSWFPH